MKSGGWMLNSNAALTAEVGIKQILKKLKAGYKNAAYEEADRKMLEIYLNRGK